MNLFALSPMQLAGGQIALAAVLGIVGLYLLLPRPRGRFVAGGIAALIASAAVFVAWVAGTFGRPLPDLLGTVLFWLFSSGALGFGAVLVVQRNPARGAIAFAFVILSVCGLFLLLAAPFLMAATIIIYAGAIIVTFLFVLMLSQAGVSDENDRTREPLYGSFAGFAFTGLVLFTLYQTSLSVTPGAADQVAGRPSHLLSPVVTADERRALDDVARRLEAAEAALGEEWGTHLERDDQAKALDAIENDLAAVIGTSAKNQVDVVQDGTMRGRLEKAAGRPGTRGVLYREDEQARAVLRRAETVRDTAFQNLKAAKAELSSPQPNRDTARAAVRKVRDEVVLLRGAGDLPAANVRNLGLVLYSEHLLAIELAGTLLLVAVIGAVAITHRKRVGEPAGGFPARREVAK